MTPCSANPMAPASRGAASRAHGHWARRASTALLWLLLLASSGPAEPARSRAATSRSPDATAGESIYRRGMLATGEPVRGERASAPAVQGAAAACVNCHRRSGLGELEGRVLVPPITARYLYHSHSGGRPSDLENSALTMAEPGARIELLRLGDRSAYTDATLARAIRDGIGPDGRALDFLMPRFRINASDMASLIAYLKQLSKRPSPGVGDDTLQFATIVTPDADPVKRRGMLDVLEHFFGKENVFSAGNSPPPQLSRRFVPIAHRWQLHVWELSGAPESWEAQLAQRLEREPVFAVISGIGGKTWEPVHRFCERLGVPCLFPNVDLPVVAEQDFYDVYLSKGVLLEAQLIADRLRRPHPAGEPTPAPRRRLVQVYRSGDIGEAAAAQLRGAAPSLSIEAVDCVLQPGADAAGLQHALADARPGDQLVLWLRPGDLERLPAQPPATTAVFLSGIMGGLEHTPLAAPWRRVASMAYPFDLPDRRATRMNYPLGWMRFKQIPVVDERTQTDTYLACLSTAETISMMGEDLVRDHLVETLEMHLGTRVANGYYPRLGLAAGQRFASKGGFLVRFAGDEGSRLVADEWSAP
jgi:cytochrome c553